MVEVTWNTTSSRARTNQTVSARSRERFIEGPSKEKEQFELTEPKLPDRLQGRVFISRMWGESCRVCDFLLIGWWGGARVVFRESQSSAFWFQPVWGLCAGAQPEMTIFHLGVGGLAPVEKLRDLYQVVLCIPCAGTWTLLQGCTVVSRQSFLSFCFPSLPS